MDAALIISCVSAVVSACSAMFAFGSSRAARRSASLPVLAGLLSEYRGKALKADRDWVSASLSGRINSQLTADERAKAASVSHFYDNIGLLVATGVADEKPLIAFLGDAAERAFWDLWPLIDDVRQRRGEYQVYFEDFVARVLASPPRTVRERARRISNEEKRWGLAKRRAEQEG